jgi:hypothetical protein
MKTAPIRRAIAKDLLLKFILPPGLVLRERARGEYPDITDDARCNSTLARLQLSEDFGEVRSFAH